MSETDDYKLARMWFDEKSAIMESLLGKEHDVVMHALIPYAIGGALDLYYFPNGITGTAIATKELCEVPHQGSSNSVLETYEMVMFTKCPLSLDDADNASTEFGRAHKKITQILNVVAPYSANARLNPNETCEMPEDMEVIGGKCFIFDAYGAQPAKSAVFGLLTIIEVFRSEMDFARKNGGAKLVAKLKDAGHYPYSDMERSPVA